MNTRKCAFLTMERPDGWCIDADLAIPHLQALGWQVECIPWRRQDVAWQQFTAVYIGTPWDYPDDPQRFLALLTDIDRSSAILINDLSLVRWNLSKTYLRDLEQNGADIVPSVWCDDLQAERLESLFDELAAGRIIVKPVISTNARDTFLLEKAMSAELCEQVLETFGDRACVAQPFIANIQSEGEYSLFYIGNEYSHAIRKTPRAKDFRVQEEHGASLILIEPEESLRSAADKALGLVDPAPLYARCDFVRGDDERFLVMEIELIEPSMYLRMKQGSAERFAKAFDAHATRAQAALC